MKEKEILGYLTQEYISSRLSLYYRKEIQKIYSDNYVKGQFFKKKGWLPKTKDNEFIMDVILRLKSMQYNDKVTIKTTLKEKLSNFFKK